LLDQDFGSKESVVFLGKFFDELLVLVEFFQIINRHIFELNILGTIDVVGIGQDTDGHARTRNIWQLYGSRETFVTLRIIVFETDLKLNGLDEFSFLVLRVL